MPKANDSDHKFKKDIKKGMISMMKTNRLLMKQVSDLYQEVAKLQDIIHNDCLEEPMLSITLSSPFTGDKSFLPSYIEKLNKFAYNVCIYIRGLYKVYNNKGWSKSPKEGRKLTVRMVEANVSDHFPLWDLDSGMMTAPSSANHSLGSGIIDERSTATNDDQEYDPIIFDDIPNLDL
ncbi:hypothetical protein BDA99DRAFT_508222 [Phascolomyces articulosus]|uniref:Uncharacterized protein n=1 Tax=Phascolomyces articulosus TaxID=60185 RepID=A0AAD5PEF4_9FUNG|nr:hypothetical protein BDA99DRAFT_508222 [Phascolomyces articulosus]